ncbi:hypothetical protein AYO38_04485 [bacterium SCGC AG-212-C10]|nr:hypothetical protein AYO38_04485 [bacterium SCGC AG-212-C10]
MDSILWVDDEPMILLFVSRLLRNRYAVTTAESGEDGLAIIERDGPFSIVVVDVHMPGMDGHEFLATVRERTPETIRIVCTGDGDIDVAATAINDGAIFRFIRKPAKATDIFAALDAAATQSHLVHAEREILEKTLVGAAGAFLHLLAKVHPSAFSRAVRVKRLAHELSTDLSVTDPWKVELAAMLSQLGLLAIPENLVREFLRGGKLSSEQQELLQSHPHMAGDLLSRIPRLEDVAHLVRSQCDSFWSLQMRNEPLSLEISLLRTVLEYDLLMQEGKDPAVAIATLCDRKGQYDPRVIDALAAYLDIPRPSGTVVVLLDELSSGMILAEDIRSANGAPIVIHGEMITSEILRRLDNFKVKQLVVKVFEESCQAA